MVSRRRESDGKDNKRAFGWGIAIAVLLLLLVLIYNFVALRREGPLPKSDATPPAAVQEHKP
ncbi:MAG: hypothetical protein J7549_00695 [Variovorax sp.]|nr:hypothetical protein [Variovorax sp.]